ncbi:MAG: hypothetical protein ACPG49_00775 [Chitinophagales bacterium]
MVRPSISCSPSIISYRNGRCRGGFAGSGSFIGSNGTGGQITAGAAGGGNENDDSVTICYTVTAPDVPTLSEWGLLILALSLMIAGTLYLIQPRFREIFELPS